jgi:hypothetical protein
LQIFNFKFAMAVFRGEREKQRRSWMALNVTPLHDRVLVKRFEDEAKKHGSLYIPDTAKEKPMRGEVLAAGTGKLRKDAHAPNAGRENRRPCALRQMVGRGV